MHALDPAKYTDAKGKIVVDIDFNRPVGEGYIKNNATTQANGTAGEYRWTNSFSVGLDKTTKKPYTAFPDISKGTKNPRSSQSEINMFDINPEIIERSLESAWHSETLEHYQEDKEYHALDFSKEEDVRFAIQKWLKNEGEDSCSWRNNEKPIYKESLRYAITKDGCLNADVWLPGIDGIGGDFEQLKAHTKTSFSFYGMNGFTNPS